MARLLNIAFRPFTKTKNPPQKYETPSLCRCIIIFQKLSRNKNYKNCDKLLHFHVCVCVSLYGSGHAFYLCVSTMCFCHPNVSSHSSMFVYLSREPRYVYICALTLFGLAYQGKDIVNRFIIEYKSLRHFGC
jgi:hypothetical protein